MKRRGFTLIELLAVIVILAIIALIATPIIMNVIENSRKGAAERSADNYLNAAEIAIASARLNNSELIEDGTYTITELEAKIGKIGVNGDTPTEGTLIIKNGQIKDRTILTLNNYTVNVVDGISKIGEFNKEGKTYSNGTAVWYNPKLDRVCSEGDEDCIKWYILEGSDTKYAYVTLIMSKSFNDPVEWITRDDFLKAGGSHAEWNSGQRVIYGPVTALNYLKTQTSDWVVEATMPSKSQIQNSFTGSTPNWLTEGLSSTVEGLRSYWTSTTFNSYGASCIHYDGNTTTCLEDVVDKETVRPVITISKDEL